MITFLHINSQLCYVFNSPRVESVRSISCIIQFVENIANFIRNIELLQNIDLFHGRKAPQPCNSPVYLAHTLGKKKKIPKGSPVEDTENIIRKDKLHIPQRNFQVLFPRCSNTQVVSRCKTEAIATYELNYRPVRAALIKLTRAD